MRENHNAVVGRLFDEVFNKLDRAVATEIVAPTYIGHDPPDSPATIRGPEGMMWSASNMHRTFPTSPYDPGSPDLLVTSPRLLSFYAA